MRYCHFALLTRSKSYDTIFVSSLNLQSLLPKLTFRGDASEVGNTAGPKDTSYTTRQALCVNNVRDKK